MWADKPPKPKGKDKTKPKAKGRLTASQVVCVCVGAKFEKFTKVAKVFADVFADVLLHEHTSESC